jgi:hypothetical protein
MFNVHPPDDPRHMPLLDRQGKPAASGQVACLTCHLPHGRPPGGGFLALDPENTPEPIVHAVKSMLRPYVPANLCESCHGFDGLRLFLYYHRNPEVDVD